MIQAYIGLGSNLDNPEQQVQHAVSELAQLPGTTLVSVSPFYRSKAIGLGEQPDYINGVALVSTHLSAEELLDRLQSIEHLHGRERSTQRWIARTLDLDLLLYGNYIIQTDRLQVPHPRMHERNFVLQPLLDLNPSLQLPNGNRINDLLIQIGQKNLWLLAEPKPQ